MLKKRNGFIWFSSLLFLLILVLENINGRFWLNDFKVYYGAAQAFWKGEPVYGQVFGEDTGLYKYSPELLILFLPSALLPYKMAAILHFTLSAIALLLGLRLALRLIEENFETEFHSSAWILTAAFFIVLNHAFRELHLGNVNLILVLMLLMAYRLQSVESWTGAAFLFALALLFKPYFVLLALPFLLRGKWLLMRRIYYFLLAALLFFTLLVGPVRSWELHLGWMKAMTEHSVILESWSTIPAILRIFLGWQGSAFLVSGLSLSIFLLVFYDLRRKFKTAADAQRTEYLLFILLLALIPSLLVTDTEHFLFAYPVIMMLLVFVWKVSKQWLIVLVPIFLLYGANSPEWLGSYLSDELEHHGALGIANVLLIATLLVIIRKYPNLKVERTQEL